MKQSEFTRAVIGSIILFLGAFGFTLQAHAAVGEVFVCEWTDGPDMDGLMSARDYYVRQAEKAGYTPPPAFVWTPVKVGPGAPDLLWFNYYDNATQYGEMTVAFDAAPEMAEVNPRFDRVATCRSGLFNQEEAFNGGEELDGPPAYIVSSACNFRSGSFNAEDLADFIGHLSDVLGSSGNYKDYLLFQQTSITRGANTPDFRLFSVHNDAAAWGARNDAFPGMEGAAALGRHFRTTFECTQNHWSGQRVIGEPGS